MRIILDARYLTSEYSGIGTYSEQFIQALAKIDQSNEYLVLVHSSYEQELELPGNFVFIEDSAKPVSIRTLTSVGLALNKFQADILHSLMPLAPLTWRGKLVTTVFDLQPLVDPDFTGLRPWAEKKAYDAFYRFAYPASMRQADYLVTCSYATKNQVMRMFPDVSDRMLVIHAGIGEDAFAPPTEEQIERVRENFNLPPRYLFYLGSTRPNKNLVNMVEAFDQFLQKHPEHDDLHFVMVLKRDRFFDPLFNDIRQRGLLRRIQIHEQVTEAEKRVMMHQAWLLYFVTKHEGFGLPVLEAQALGLPVIASTHASLPEVAGKAALLADPDNVDDIVSALERAHRLGLREELSKRGPQNARRFSWEAAAKEVLDMYNHLLA